MGCTQPPKQASCTHSLGQVKSQAEAWPPLVAMWGALLLSLSLTHWDCRVWCRGAIGACVHLVFLLMQCSMSKGLPCVVQRSKRCMCASCLPAHAVQNEQRVCPGHAATSEMHVHACLSALTRVMSEAACVHVRMPCKHVTMNTEGDLKPDCLAERSVAGHTLQLALMDAPSSCSHG